MITDPDPINKTFVMKTCIIDEQHRARDDHSGEI